MKNLIANKRKKIQKMKINLRKRNNLPYLHQEAPISMRVIYLDTFVLQKNLTFVEQLIELFLIVIT
jgi:hypothetical protein